MVAGVKDSFQKDVQACGDAGSKDYILSSAGGEMKKLQKLFSCIQDLFFQRVGVAVGSPVHVYGGTGQITVHSIGYPGSFGAGGGRLVQIDLPAAGGVLGYVVCCIGIQMSHDRSFL